MNLNTDDNLAKARALAEDFARLKTPQFLKAFLKDTEIANILYEYQSLALEDLEMDEERYLDLLVKEYSVPFGQALALAYCLGFMDRAQSVPTTTYREKSKIQQGSKPCELVTGKE